MGPAPRSTTPSAAWPPSTGAAPVAALGTTAWTYANGVPDSPAEAYAYLGLSTVVERDRPEAGHALTYLGATNDNSDSKDWYAGLDRFGYGYDANGNRLYEKNLVESSLSELYVDPTTGAYDALDRLTKFAHGTLADADSDGVDDVDAFVAAVVVAGEDRPDAQRTATPRNLARRVTKQNARNGQPRARPHASNPTLRLPARPLSRCRVGTAREAVQTMAATVTAALAAEPVGAPASTMAAAVALHGRHSTGAMSSWKSATGSTRPAYRPGPTARAS